ncbi:MAG TPA: HNH endonuclease domain-containing protein [Bacteroidales bacterium]|nr:HNH endonuclease domain-containing protein [Bacteroidales bacterium]HOR82368.1 HNH endonuclease domain-containing protein [Bacteroidales bacterium]HPJ91070.1 HNH endonuclease domain-containing protein [Bacteroidales bacterium]
MKKILGLDLGTNSIGWALIEIDHEKRVVKIIGLGSRILPMDAGEIKNFESGSTKIKSSAAIRTEYRGNRRLNERYLLRRDRLHIVLDLLDALPTHYKLEIDFTNKKGEKCGQFKTNKEPKLAYLPKQKGEKAKFLFMDSYQKMLNDINDEKVKNEKHKRIPYDWTLYYLRQKALSEEISLDELAWVLLSYNQKRGYEKTEVEDKSTKDTEFVEELDLRVLDVFEKEKEGKKYFEIHLDGNDKFTYNEYSDIQMTFKDDLKEVVKTSKVDDEGNIDKQKTEYKIIDIYPLKIQKFDYEKIETQHVYTLTYQNGWVETQSSKKNNNFRYKNALNKSYDYIVETLYDNKGNLKFQQGKERKLREPDFGDNSSDWTLLKKKTEKEALAFNSNNGFLYENGDVKKFISPKIYNILKNDAIKGIQTKIIGGIFQVVDRDFYREELNQIIDTQRKIHTNLKDKEIFEKCVKTLYPKNEKHRESLLANKETIRHLLVEDILLYQRPLKSKKSEIADCKHEIRYWKNVEDKNGNPIEEVDVETGEVRIKKEPVYIKVISTSHPCFQEFRIWDKLHDLKLIQLEKEVNGKLSTNQDITKDFFKSSKEYQELFDEFNNRKSLNQDQFLNYCKKKFKIDYNQKNSNFAWNFPEDEELKGNETRVSFATRFKRCGFSNYRDFLTLKKELELWHYLYSVNYRERTANNKKSIRTFFNTYFKNFQIEKEVKEKIINDFSNYPKFASNYCSYSEKALKKFIPIISLGERDNEYYWTSEKWYKDWQATLEERKLEILKRLKNIDFNADKPDYSKVEHTDIDLSKGELPFPKGLFNVFREFSEPEDFNKLNLTRASYLIYGRHSELAFAKYWQSPEQIRKELHQELKQHSLNNPVAEKVLLEMMQIVADIWEYYGKSAKDFFSRIHVEVGRELKKSAKEKEAETKRMSSNKSQNKRLRQILEDFLTNQAYNANPNNSDHFERLKIAEEGAEHKSNIDKKFYEENEKLKAENITKKDIDEILKKTRITQQEFEKYKLWIEQGYRSPYSGRMIKLTDLFDGKKYNIDHVFPQASITNNSLSNKVVVEVELNKLKGDKTGREFIQQQNGQEYLGIPVCTEDEYVEIVKSQFSGTKRYILLSKEIPKGFISSQLNTARHIARKAMELLSHIVREEGEIEFRSKNVLPVTGAVTSELKQAWKLNEVWTELVSPRFIRLNKLTQSNLFGEWQKSKNGHDYFDCNLDQTIRDKNEAYNIKRIDHRHHALDALIVALCTEEHVNYINNINANAKSDDYGKQKQIENYRKKLKRKIMFSKKDDTDNEKDWYYMLPGEKRMDNAKNSDRSSVIEVSYNFKEHDTFHSDYRKMILTALQHTIVTFKQNLRVINNRVNYYQAEPNTKKRVAQEPKTKKDINNSSNKYNWGIRRSLNKETFYGKRIVNNEERRVGRELLNITFKKDKIKKVSDEKVKQILLKHLSQFDTVEIPFEEAIIYFDALLEKEEFEAIINDNDENIKTNSELIDYLKNNKFKYKKTDYSKLNVFIDKVKSRDFRQELQFKDKIKENPEIAFTPEAIEKMNESEEIKRLNNGENHKPIKKVQIWQSFGKERPLSENQLSVKSKQYVVTAADSNLYLGFYERTYRDENNNQITDRKFQDIGLTELIEHLKQETSKRFNPLPNGIFDNEMNKYNWKFTLSPLDLVYVPTKEEIDCPELVDIENLTKEQIERIYKYVDGSENHANFIPYSASTPIWRFHGDKIKKQIFDELNEKNKLSISEKDLIQNEFGLGSQQDKNQNMIDGKTQIKKICWKLETNRLGQIKKVSR